MVKFSEQKSMLQKFRANVLKLQNHCATKPSHRSDILKGSEIFVRSASLAAPANLAERCFCLHRDLVHS